MKVNVNQAFTELDGTVIKDGEHDFTLKEASVRALNTPVPSEKLSEEEKMKRFNLARKIYKGGVVDLTTDECALIKNRIHVIFDSPLIYTEAYEMIEGAPKE